MIIAKGNLVMNKEEFEKKLEEQIEIKKKNAIEEIEKGQMIPAMWSISELIDLKAQLGILKGIKED